MAKPPGNRAPDSAPSPWRGVRPWLLASLLAHALWLAPTPGQRLAPPAFQGGPLQVRWVTSPAASDAPLAPAAAPVERAPHQPAAATARAAAVPSPVEAASLTATAPAWPPSGRWHYALQWRGVEGEAVLSWQLDDAQYRLRLERQTGDRALPVWQSEGRIDAQGLRPERFSAGGGNKEHTRWQFSAGQLLPHRGEAQAAPLGTQDRLSWMWQLALQAARQPPRSGERLQISVAAWRGAAQAWDMQAEPDPVHPHWLHLRRVMADGSLAEQRIWLDPARGHLPVRLEIRYDAAERWSLMLIEPPPVAAQAPSSP